MQPFEVIVFCPHCGERRATAPSIPFHCVQCGLKLYFNTTVSVSAFIFGADGKLLLIRRAKDPAKGRLATVGGFVDIGETAEGALVRELKEEIGAEVEKVKYLTSAPNDYHYAGVTYPVLDLFYVCNLKVGHCVNTSDEACALVWCTLGEVDAEDLAFESMRVAFRALDKFVQTAR